ncbi:MAG: serine/threonine protein kinase [Gemmatimonadota bacterium]|nr:serine/threonine protein kinase [Gemmatimonadota bacterium]
MPETSANEQDPALRGLIERALSASYEIDREIGRGGMGIVYRAKDRRLKRTVAIKLLPPELSFRSEIKTRFLREAETAAQLSHPSIVPIYSVDERDGLVFFVMSCVEGPTLAKRLHDEGRLGVEETRRILREVADALSYAHGRGVIHRDIKPDNILLDADSGRALVTDFGIARAIQEGGDSRLTATGMAIGTPAYMSPEQAVGDKVIDGRSDLYALGIVAYQMLVGEPPFIAASTPAMLMKHLTEHPVPVSERRVDVPSQLSATVMMLLEKEPERRFPNAGALVLALDGGAIVTPPPRRSGEGSAPGSTPHSGRHSGPARPPVGAPASAADGEPTRDDMARWMAPGVVTFRKKFASYAMVNAVIILAAIFTGIDLLFVPVIWSIFIAANYAKLWSSGYDWRDVFRQSRERRLLDVAQETVDEVVGVFDHTRREKVAARRRTRNPLFPAATDAPPQLAPPVDASLLGARAGLVHQAANDRVEILRLVDSLPKAERQLVSDIIPSADGLYRRIQALAISLAELERTTTADAKGQLEAQIAQLEAQANPFERAASEERVRRLAFLKRQRSALTDQARRRGELAAKLESCALALGGMKLDVIRLRAGGVSQSLDQITMLTERARSLAADVDAAVYAQDEVGRVMAGSKKNQASGARR